MSKEKEDKSKMASEVSKWRLDVPGLKGKVVAKVTQDELAVFLKMAAVRDQVTQVLEGLGHESRRVWKMMDAKYGLDGSKHKYEVDMETGEIIENF